MLMYINKEILPVEDCWVKECNSSLLAYSYVYEPTSVCIWTTLDGLSELHKYKEDMKFGGICVWGSLRG